MSVSANQLNKTFHALLYKILLAITFAGFTLLYLLRTYQQEPIFSLLIVVCLLILAAVVFIVSRHYQRQLNLALTDIFQLQQWAIQSKITGQLQPLGHSDELLHQIVHDMLQQLEQAKNSDSEFDATLRGNALLDKQTGVGNREFFNNRLEALLKEDDVQGAVYFIQFKGFEVIHALYGDKQVNTLLETLITTIKQRLTLMPNIYIARRAEFELALIIPGIFITEAEKLADKLINSLATMPLPVGINQEEFVHIGVSYFSHAENSYQIKSEADMALRSAQLHGPSQWFMFEPGEVEHARAKGSLQWRTFLVNAIKKNAFVVFFQPVIAKDGVHILHHEVLIKVRDTDGGLLSARVFLPMAKKCGLVKNIDLLVLEQVLRILRYDKNQQDNCSLNLSIESLLAKEFIENLLTMLASHHQLASRLIIEISEYHLANHLRELKPVLHSLHQLGVKLLVDKVGQYVESAHYLKSCPIDAIKLHRSIVLDIDHKPENQIFVQSLHTICSANKVDVYALGVESEQEWQTLLRLGVNGGQGHYFTEPVAQVAKAIHLP